MICLDDVHKTMMQGLYNLGKWINTCKNFSWCFIDPRPENVSKESVAKHIKPDQQKAANRLKLKWILGRVDYQEKIVMESLIAKCFVKLSDENSRTSCENQYSSLLTVT